MTTLPYIKDRPITKEDILADYRVVYKYYNPQAEKLTPELILECLKEGADTYIISKLPDLIIKETFDLIMESHKKEPQETLRINFYTNGSKFYYREMWERWGKELVAEVITTKFTEITRFKNLKLIGYVDIPKMLEHLGLYETRYLIHKPFFMSKGYKKAIKGEYEI